MLKQEWGRGNRLLRALSAADYARIAPAFERHKFAFREVLFEQGKKVDHVYFMETGVLSLITDFEDGTGIETGTVGNEGVVSVHTVLGVERAPYRGICQMAGEGIRVRASVIDNERKNGTEWFQVLLRFVAFFTATAGQLAACNRLHTVDARMSRWLLMTHDRVQGDDFQLTQEFLANMLGVARPTVNIAGATLQRAGLIKYSRGRVTVTDRRGLEDASCECYGRIVHEMETALNVA